MLRKYMFQLTQYTYNSRNFNRDFSNMWGPSDVLINATYNTINTNKYME